MVSNVDQCSNRCTVTNMMVGGGPGGTDKLVSKKYHNVSNWVQCSTRPNTYDFGGGVDKSVSNKYHKVYKSVQCINRPNTCECWGGTDKSVSKTMIHDTLL
jgi:hypothetical protein